MKKIQPLLNNEVLTIKDLLSFVNHKDEEIRIAVAENPNVSSSILRILSEDMSERVKRVVAESHKTAPSTLDFLAKSTNDEYVLSAIAWNDNAKPSTLDYLYKLNSKKITAGLSLNKNSSEDLLHSIALGTNTFFKKYVSENESTAPETLDYLAKESNSTLIKIEVAKNSSTSIDTLFYLANLKDPELYYPIKTNINLTEELFQLINKLEYQ